MDYKGRKQSSWKFIYYVSNEGDIVPYELDPIGCHKTKFKKLSKRTIGEIYFSDILMKSSKQNNESNNLQTPSQNHKITQHNNKYINYNANQDDQSDVKEDEKQYLNSNTNKIHQNENSPYNNIKIMNQIDQSNVKNNIFTIPNINAYQMNQNNNIQYNNIKNKNQIDQSNVKNNIFTIPNIKAYQMNQHEYSQNKLNTKNKNTDAFNFNLDQIDFDYIVNSYDSFYQDF